MPTILLNPRLWTITTVRLDEDNTLAHGDTVDVSVEEWEDIRTRRTRQFGSRHRTYVTTEEVQPEPERTWVRTDALNELTRSELADIAKARGLPYSGNKKALVTAITADAEAAENAL